MQYIRPDYFYAYMSPLPGDVQCYYGRSIDPWAEFKERWEKGKGPPYLQSWFKEIRDAGLELQIHCLEIWEMGYIPKVAETREHLYWGKQLEAAGFQILNIVRTPTLRSFPPEARGARGRIATLSPEERKEMGRKGGLKGGPIGGPKAGRLVQAKRTPERRKEISRMGGLVSGRRNAENGHMARIGRIYGPIQGHKAVECGRLAKIGVIGGRIAGRKAVESGQLAKLNRHNIESGHNARIAPLGGKKGNHIRWHVRRGVFSPKCSLCAPPAELSRTLSKKEAK